MKHRIPMRRMPNRFFEDVTNKFCLCLEDINDFFDLEGDETFDFIISDKKTPESYQVKLTAGRQYYITCTFTDLKESTYSVNLILDTTVYIKEQLPELLNTPVYISIELPA